MAEHEDDESRSPALGLHDPGRLLALTDAVFAIIMTLLALELHVPPAEHGDRLADALLDDGVPTLIAYVISFLLAGVYWIGHRDLFSYVKYVDYGVIWANVVFLMTLSLIPFAATLVGRHGDEPLALQLYGLMLAALAGARLYMFWHVTSRPRLLYRPIAGRHRSRVMAMMAIAVVAFLVSIAVVHLVPFEAVMLVYGVTPIIVLTSLRRAERARAG